MPNYTKLLTTLIFTFFVCINSISQIDTEFWFAVPEVSKNNNNSDRPISLILSTLEDTAKISIYQPANPNFLTLLIVLQPNTTKEINLTYLIDQLEVKPANMILKYGINIVSDNPISAYYQICSGSNSSNAEIFVLKGRSALGQNFIIPGQTSFNNSDNYIPKAYSSFDVVATEDNTIINFKITNDIVGYAAGQTFTKILNRGEVYSAAAVSSSSSMRLVGSQVSSNKPIAITVKDDFIRSASTSLEADLTGDQILPVENLGKEFIAIRGGLHFGLDRFFILSSENNNTIYINGNYMETIDKAETYTFIFDTLKIAHIQTSQPSYVYQLTGKGGEMSSSLVPKIGCSGSQSISFRRTNAHELFVKITVKSNGINNFKINNQTNIINPSFFSHVPNTNNDWMYLVLPLDVFKFPVGERIEISNSSNIFHLAVLSGENTESSKFGYLTSFSSFETDLQISSIEFCKGGTAQLNVENLFGTSFTWTGPHGFSDSGETINIPNFDSTMIGWYTVFGNNNFCEIYPDSIYVEYLTNPEVDFTYTNNCAGENTMFFNLTNLSAPDSSYSYFWDFGNGQYSSDRNPIFQFQQAGSYNVKLIFTNNLGCTDSITKTIRIDEPPLVLFEHNNVCFGETINFLNFSSSCTDDTYSYYWEFGNGKNSNERSPNVLYRFPGTYNVTLTVNSNNGCSSKMSNLVTVYEKPNANIEVTPEYAYTSNPSFTFNSNTNAQNWLWDMGDGKTISTFPPFNYTYPAVESEHAVTLHVMNEHGCTDSTKIYLSILDFNFNIPNIITPNGDGFNDYFLIENIEKFPNNSITILNRWGNTVFNTINYTNNFDGANLADGTYFYIIKIAHKTFEGSLTILRKY